MFIGCTPGIQARRLGYLTAAMVVASAVAVPLLRAYLLDGCHEFSVAEWVSCVTRSVIASGPATAGGRGTGRSLLLPLRQRTDVKAPFETLELTHPVFFYDDVLVMPHHTDRRSPIGGTAQHGPHDRRCRAGSI
jgi:hypothetical protein